MAGNNVEMTHAEMWDDSALIDSWNEALDESSWTSSLTPNDLRRTADAETQAVDQPAIVDSGEGANKTKAADGSTDVQPDSAGVPIADAISDRSGNVGGPATMAPQSLLGSVQDEGLKRLLMSWYYAGYYTGLYEGQQQQQQQQQPPPRE
ncbi:Survival motor neuron-like protein 1 [Colletotrichum chlorophyti]|uniref:Survival motor neuron-like protein 1 n=1 Tax=Colletotrichum chlorophyti TaxID=708187 RepID=A0A1Q8RYQ2_9PEZI|nr:Survival motor neuron-like protein 1 [Colletotrichum chlorophyti]